MALSRQTGKLGLLLILTGCSSAPTTSSPQVSLEPPRPVQTRTTAIVPVRHVLPVPVSLDDLIATALRTNPRLQSLAHQVQAAWEKVPQVRSLPDPSVGANVFGHAIETAAGSQQAILSVRQQIPSLRRLRAQEQQAAILATGLEQSLRAEQLRILAGVKTGWARLWLLDQQIRINEANQKILESIIKVELTRAGTAGRKTAVNDTLRATLEKTRLEEALGRLKQARSSTIAQINELLNRPSQAKLPEPKELDVLASTPAQEALLELAVKHQPELIAARMRSEAARVGLDVAHLQRVPDVMLSANWFFTDDNRPPSRIVNVGQDAWSVGAMINVPLWHQKNDARDSEARSRHAASLADVEALRLRYDARLADLLAQAKSAQQTLRIYEKAILPQAQQTFRMDRQGLGAGTVELDRVMTDLQNLIILEVELYRARATLATIQAQLEQIVGLRLDQMDNRRGEDSNENREPPEGKPIP